MLLRSSYFIILMKIPKEATPFSVWLSEKNYTGHRNKRMFYSAMGIGIMIGFSLGILIF